MSTTSPSSKQAVPPSTRLRYSVAERLTSFGYVPAICLILGVVIGGAVQVGAEKGFGASVAFFAFFALIGLPFFLADVRLTPDSVRSGLGPLSFRIRFTDIRKAEIGTIGYQRLNRIDGIVLRMRNGKTRKLRLSTSLSHETQRLWLEQIQRALTVFHAPF